MEPALVACKPDARNRREDQYVGFSEQLTTFQNNAVQGEQNPTQSTHREPVPGILRSLRPGAVSPHYSIYTVLHRKLIRIRLRYRVSHCAAAEIIIPARRGDVRATRHGLEIIVVPSYLFFVSAECFLPNKSCLWWKE